MNSRVLGLTICVGFGCGGGGAKPVTPGPAAPETTEPVAPRDVADAPPPPEEAAPPQEPAAPPAPPPKPFADRLLDAEGPVPGMPGFSIARKPSKKHCTGVEIVTKRSKKIAKDDAPLAEVYAIEFPKGLNFDPNDAKKKEASMKKFNDWLEMMMDISGKAQKHYEASLTANKDLASVVRIAQIAARLSSVIGRAEIPPDVRTGQFSDEKTAAYCDAMQNAAEPLLARAEEALRICADKSAGQPTGWWTAVCTPAP
jgi:hypothetical protein